jgi:hypothetical protein
MHTLFVFLQHFWLLIGVLGLAAGATVDLGGGGADAAGGSEGSEGGAEQDGGDADESEAGGDGSELEETGGDVDEHAGNDTAGDTSQAAVGGRKLSPALKQHLEEVKAANPAVAKELKGVIFSDQAFRQQFPGGPMEAQRTKQLIERAGGSEGIQRLQKDAQELTAIDAKVAAGDPAVLDFILTSSPDGFSKIMPVALQKFAEKDPEMYQHQMSRVISNTLANAGLVNVLEQLRSSLSNPQKAGGLIDAMVKWARNFDQMAAKPPEKKVDPERQKLELEKKNWTTQKLNETKKAVFSDVRSYNLSSIETRLAREFSAAKRNLAAYKKSDPDSFQLMMENCYTAVDKLAVQDKDFVKAYVAALNAGDRNKALDLAKKRISKIVNDSSVKNAITRVYRAFNKGGKPAPAAAGQRPAGTQQARTPGAIKLAAPPRAEQLDKSPGRTTNAMIDKGEAWLKDGRHVVWDWK